MLKSLKYKILFVYEKDKPQDFVVNTFAHVGYEIVLADSIQRAKDEFLKANFKAVLSDRKLIDGDGFEVLNFIRRISPVPFVMINDSSTATDKDDEGNELLNFTSMNRPYRENDLLSTVQGILKAQEPDHFVLQGSHCEDVEESFAIIDIDEFVSGHEIKYDIYISIGDKKFIKLAQGSAALSEGQIERLKLKGVDSLYMRKSDFRNYLEMTVNLIKHMPKLHISANRKSAFIQMASRTLSESIISREVDPKALSHAKTVVDSTINMLTGCDEILLTLEFLKNDHKSLFSHSLNVALYAVMMARDLKMNSYETLVKLTSACMFHDHGKSKLPPMLNEIPEWEMSPAEKKMLEIHVVYGVEMIRAIEGMPEDVISIIIQHHEDESGGGYPTGISGKGIHPLAKIVKVADDFCEMMQDKVPSLVNILWILEQMETSMAHKYDQECVAALRRCFEKHKMKE